MCRTHSLVLKVFTLSSLSFLISFSVRNMLNLWRRRMQHYVQRVVNLPQTIRYGNGIKGYHVHGTFQYYRMKGRKSLLK